MMSAAVAGTTFRPTPSYTTLRDVTPGGDPSRRGQPEAVKDNPLRAPKAQRQTSITLSEQKRGGCHA